MDFVYAGSFQSPGTIGKLFTEYGGEKIFFLIVRVPHLCEWESMCVMNCWKHGVSWKSSAAVSLLLAACVHVSEGWIYRENKKKV